MKDNNDSYEPNDINVTIETSTLAASTYKTIKGCGVIPGVVEGEALVCPKSVTGWKGVDPLMGIMQENGHVNRGKSIKDKILIIPGSKGSNGWSCFFSATKPAKTSPKAILATSIDSSAGVAIAFMQIPAIVDFPKDEDPCKLFRNGDRLRIDGGSGVVELIK